MNVKAKMWSCLEKKMNKVGFFDYIFQYANNNHYKYKEKTRRRERLNLENFYGNGIKVSKNVRKT